MQKMKHNTENATKYRMQPHTENAFKYYTYRQCKHIQKMNCMMVTAMKHDGSKTLCNCGCQVPQKQGMNDVFHYCLSLLWAI